MAAASQLFGRIPVVAMEQDSRGVPTYFGRPDLVRFLASVLHGDDSLEAVLRELNILLGRPAPLSTGSFMEGES
jgi:hypothetical protein